jgi:hypothetical protein
MKITYENGNPDAWVCLCGNTPSSDGFYPCNHEGQEVEPTPAEWTTNWYVCNRCGRMIGRTTLEVVGVRQEAHLPNEAAA